VPDYVNSHDYDLHLVGPDGKKVIIRRGKSICLPSFFDRYVKRGFLKHLRTSQRPTVTETVQPKKYHPSRSQALGIAKKRSLVMAEQGAASALTQAKNAEKQPASNRIVSSKTKHTLHRINKSRARQINESRARQRLQAQIVGRGFKRGATEALHKTLSTMFYPISNGVGVGILSFNRPKSLRRLVNSIVGTTDLQKTTVFISDDGSTDVELHRYFTKLEKTNNFVILRNRTRLGIAGNSNRLLRCLQRFPSKLLLNDDVEVLAKGWEHFYFNTMYNTGLHHFCLNQPGVYGASEGVKQPMRDKLLIRVDVRPHGAVMALDDRAFAKVGYFNEAFGYYGMEHVDWSTRVAAAKLQPPGYWDVDGATKYFRIHSDRSAVPDRIKHLQIARSKYTAMGDRPVKIAASGKSKVPSISCIIPFKDIGRHQSIMTAINNIRAQRFPCIEMIAAEQDDQSCFKPDELCCLTHLLVATPGKPFNKSMAFNAGVSRASHDKLLLHDADTLVPAHYTQLVFDTLDRADSCHLGARVIYADKTSTDSINTHNRVDKTVTAEKIVTYFEGGSIACLTDTFWKVGGFVEDYWGYGCFAQDNYVLTANGYKDIADVVDGEYLYTHEGRFRPATTRKRFYKGEILNIFVAGRLGIKGVTPEHPFLVRDGEEFVWKIANNIKEGDELLDTDFMSELLPPYDIELVTRSDRSHNRSKFGTVTKIDSNQHTGMVYNFEVSGDHSYVVNGLAVHNCEDCNFYFRLSKGSRWHENRIIDLVHLWHIRTSGWMKYHDANKVFEKQLAGFSVEDQILKQHKYLKNTSYAKFVSQALARQ